MYRRSPQETSVFSKDGFCAIMRVTRVEELVLRPGEWKRSDYTALGRGGGEDVR